MLGYDFDRQRPIDNYIVDFYCKDLMLAINSPVSFSNNLNTSILTSKVNNS